MFCQIDWSRLDRIATYTVPANEPIRPALLFSISPTTMTIQPLSGEGFHEVTPDGYEYLAMLDTADELPIRWIEGTKATQEVERVPVLIR